MEKSFEEGFMKTAGIIGKGIKKLKRFGQTLNPNTVSPKQRLSAAKDIKRETSKNFKTLKRDGADLSAGQASALRTQNKKLQGFARKNVFTGRKQTGAVGSASTRGRATGDAQKTLINKSRKSRQGTMRDLGYRGF